MTAVTNESKNTVSVTNDAKPGADRTWDESTETWDESTGTWELPASAVTKEAKNTATVTNENKI